MRFIFRITLAASLALLPLQMTRALVAGSYNIRYDSYPTSLGATDPPRRE